MTKAKRRKIESDMAEQVTGKATSKAVKEKLSREIIDINMDVSFDEGSIEEAVADPFAKGVKVRIMKPGISHNGNWHRSENMRRALDLLDGVWVYEDHTDKRLARQKLARLTSPVWEDELPKANMRILPGTGKWLAENIQADPSSVDLSINAQVAGEWVMHEGRKVFDVKEYMKFRSVDVVAEASAGGGAESIIEAKRREEVVDMPIETMKELLEAHGDMVNEWLTEQKQAWVDGLTEDVELKKLKEAKEAAEAEVAKVAEFGGVDALLEAHKEVVKKLDDLETARKISEWTAEVDGMLAGSVKEKRMNEDDISEAFKNRLYAMTEKEVVESEIKDREELVAKLRGGVKGHGKPVETEVVEETAETDVDRYGKLF